MPLSDEDKCGNINGKFSVIDGVASFNDLQLSLLGRQFQRQWLSLKQAGNRISFAAI